jgi:hypothetical protein
LGWLLQLIEQQLGPSLARQLEQLELQQQLG